MDPNRFNDYWFRMSWTQPYVSWPEPKTTPKLEPEITDLTQAREVLARIMAK